MAATVNTRAIYGKFSKLVDIDGRMVCIRDVRRDGKMDPVGPSRSSPDCSVALGMKSSSGNDILLGFDSLSQVNAVADVALLHDVINHVVGMQVNGVGAQRATQSGTLIYVLCCTDGQEIDVKVRGVYVLPHLPLIALCAADLVQSALVKSVKLSAGGSKIIIFDGREIKVKFEDSMFFLKAKIVRPGDTALLASVTKFERRAQIEIGPSGESYCFVASRDVDVEVSYHYAHSLLGHPGRSVMNKARRRGLIKNLIWSMEGSELPCIPCEIANSRRPDRAHKGHMATRRGEVFFVDILAVSIPTFWGGNYGCCFIDSATRLAIPDIVARKSHVDDGVSGQLDQFLRCSRSGDRADSDRR